ncbi:Flavonol sulfotransferase-like protein [Morus notabilis]|uniref:Sulfotransferase n=1 Tax=Morus notabilis TaxID=981085 RepID=W9RNV4_9ROSA|nr:Flavonol sulfotransferase-like protein [Morus notabilis]
MGVTNYTKADESEEEQVSDECKQMLLSLPKTRGSRTSHLYQYQGFWCQTAEIQAIASFQKHFQAFDSDVVVASIPKSGTTWLKALAFAVANRDRFPVSDDAEHPLLTSNPHDLTFRHTHSLYPSSADSLKSSNWRIVYICRNPFDAFVSTWHFMGSLFPLSLEEAFEMFCQGLIGYGPFWDHMLGYWKESLGDVWKTSKMTLIYVKKLAEFFKCPFSLEDERNGVIEKIVKLCSFENLKELEVNKKGKSLLNFEKGRGGGLDELFEPSNGGEVVQSN